ncbi:MAG: hypothetical protein EOO42_00885 [Flavobacteriales bacterium]|nr:MAG: hypothetical protein EOO42_00885 [Flavobacteriales bacterium]
MFSQAKTKIVSTCIVSLLILLWSYTVVSKLSNVTEFDHQLQKQAFSPKLGSVLIWLVPLSEIIAIMLLIFERTRLFGMWLSLVLMGIFTGYIALVLLGFYHKVPCSCGGVISQLGWYGHLWFNLFFLAISAIGIYLLKLEQKYGP